MFTSFRNKSVLNEMFIWSLFYVTCLLDLVTEMLSTVSFSYKNYKHGK